MNIQFDWFTCIYQFMANIDDSTSSKDLIVLGSPQLSNRVAIVNIRNIFVKGIPFLVKKKVRFLKKFAAMKIFQSIQNCLEMAGLSRNGRFIVPARSDNCIAGSMLKMHVFLCCWGFFVWPLFYAWYMKLKHSPIIPKLCWELLLRWPFFGFL